MTGNMHIGLELAKVVSQTRRLWDCGVTYFATFGVLVSVGVRATRFHRAAA
jgi:hypothetical protein